MKTFKHPQTVVYSDFKPGDVIWMEDDLRPSTVYIDGECYQTIGEMLPGVMLCRGVNSGTWKIWRTNENIQAQRSR